MPRSDIRNIREGGRALSTLVGMVAGVGLGAGIGAANGTEGAPLADALFLGLLGAGIGHLAPFKGHVIYRRP